jgi:Zn-finger nucleic acid-binding protein
MKCPACGNRLQRMTVGEVSVDACRGGCGGIWFDNHELQKFDEPHEADGEALLDLERNRNIHVDFHKKRHCPKCNKVVMTRRFFNDKRQVEIDECPNCAGVWLDYGELGTIRATYASEQDREKAAEEYLREVLDADFAAGPGHDDLDTSHRMSRIFRFLTPRYRFWH